MPCLWHCCGVATWVSKMAAHWMRLACSWEWAGSKLRNLEKTSAGRGDWPRSVRHCIRCHGQVRSALWTWVCGDSCLLRDCSSSTHHRFFLPAWPVLLCIVRAPSLQQGTRSCSAFFYVVCFSISSLGLIYNVISLLQIDRIYNLKSTDIWELKQCESLCYLIWSSYRQEQMLVCFESLQ